MELSYVHCIRSINALMSCVEVTNYVWKLGGRYTTIRDLGSSLTGNNNFKHM
jgi:hypothetical protein